MKKFMYGLLAATAVVGTFQVSAMEAKLPELEESKTLVGAVEEEISETDKKKVEEIIHKGAQKYSLGKGEIPKEILGAIMANLSPEDLFIASQVSAEWQFVAAHLMIGKLAQQKIHLTIEKNSPEEVVSKYKRVFLFRCPQFSTYKDREAKDKEDFLKIIKTVEKSIMEADKEEDKYSTFENYSFDWHNKTWHISPQDVFELSTHQDVQGTPRSIVQEKSEVKNGWLTCYYSVGGWMSFHIKTPLSQ